MTNQFYDIAKKIDKLVREYSPENLEAIEECFKVEGIKYYFFTQKLKELEAPQPWLVPLKDKGYFGGEKNPPAEEVKDQPGFYAMPFWNVLKYLENVAQKNKKTPSSEITNALAEIVDSIINYRDAKGERIDNYRTDWFITKIIFMLPYEKWGDKHIDFIGTAIGTTFGGSLIQSEIGKSVLPALIENKIVDLILKLLEVILSFTKLSKDKLDKIRPVMDKHWLRDALKKFKKQIAELCGTEAAKIGISTIKAVLKEDEGKFSYVWIPTIEESGQTKFPDRYQCQLVFFVRDILENSKTEDIRGIVESLLSEKHDILKRIRVHTINHHYKDFQDMFWKWKGNPLDEHPCKHELYILLKSNCSSFSKEQINKVLAWIESKDYGDFDDSRREQVLAYRKKEWLSALLETKEEDIKTAYDKYNKICSIKLKHPGFSVWSEGGAVRQISPITQEVLLSKSNEEIVKYLNEYKEEEGNWSLERVGEKGLSDCLKECVLEKPEKFASDMKPFIHLKRIYQNSVLRGLNEAWNAKKEFALEGVFCFISQLIEENEFWNEKYDKDKGEFNYRNWLVCEVAEFIESGTRDDKNAFDEKYLPDIEKILLLLAEKAESHDSGTERIIDSVLNSPKGRVFSAMITYSFCYARLNKDKKVRWPEPIKSDFTKRLDRNLEPSLDYSVSLGKYLGNLLYLDRKWVFDNIEEIFPKEKPQHWEAAFIGYLSYSQNVYEEIYGLIRKNGHYAKALESKFDDDYVHEKLVQHICIGFLEDWEKLENAESLICLLLNKGKVAELSELVHFLWTIEEGEPLKKAKERIKPLWKALFDLVSKHEDDRDYQGLISRFYLWLDIVDEIDDEIKQWVKLTAKYVNVDYHASDLVKYLAKHVDRKTKNVGEIYIEMLNGGAYPDYDQKDITKVVKCLYEKGYKEYADSICNKYGEVGYYLLRDMYEKYHK